MTQFKEISFKEISAPVAPDPRSSAFQPIPALVVIVRLSGRCCGLGHPMAQQGGVNDK
ncbi:MAG: hypothetical protein IRY99_02405 [Isosphaeraceae bacterium]|nr:hypothetical protein [Isosphaeraceae bacterium]